jgi:hypothetical protein
MKETLYMMDQLSKLDQVTSQAISASKTVDENGHILMMSAADKEQCVMDNITPLKKAILKILLYSDLLAEQKEVADSKNTEESTSLFAYFNKQELPVM